MRDRRAEDRHHRVADEFLDEAVVALDRLRQRLEQRVLERADLFGVEPLRQRREPGKVGEEDGHLPPVGFAPVRLSRGRDVSPPGPAPPVSAAAGVFTVGAELARGSAAGAEREVGLERRAAGGAGRRLAPPAARAKREVQEMSRGRNRRTPSYRTV